ncbi:Crp/Fnr family transcriptional regulator [Methylocystis sp. 9N]|uniref:Crp/Fnr family transcriptional regulator n=1 Tax=Methylocystis borbori TaxID=3118750 RepID=A0ABU7XGA7_9HYPH
MPRSGKRSAMRPKRPDSNLLQALRNEDFALIERFLMEEVRESEDVLYNPGDNIAKVYFPLGPSLVSYLVPNIEGRDVETVLVGREGAVGGIVSSGFLPAYCRIIVKYGGNFACATVSSIQAAKEQSISFRRLFARYADCLMAQMFQATACNAIHSIEQRSAKWLIAAIDRTGSDTVPLSQEQLASLLGVGRSYTSRVIQNLKADGVLETARGKLTVKNRDLLAAKACDCNESIKSHFEVVLRGVYPD